MVLSTAKAGTNWFKDVADYREGPYVDMQPDLVLYPKHKRARSAYTLTKDQKLDQPAYRRRYMAQYACAWAMAFVECKGKEEDSAFHFSDENMFLRNDSVGRRCRARMAEHAADIQVCQHRTHLWSFYFAGPRVRLQRWDRAGCMVSTALDIRDSKDATEFIHFLYRFVRLNPEQMGYDSAAIVATPKEIKMVQDYVSDNKYLKMYRDHMLVSEDEFPIYKASRVWPQSTYTTIL